MARTVWKVVRWPLFIAFDVFVILWLVKLLVCPIAGCY